MNFRVQAEQFAAILRETDSPQWQTAFDDLRHAFASLIARSRAWPRVGEMGAADNPADLADQLAHDFWIFLRENPRALDAASIQGAGAIHRQLVRFLLQRRSVSVDRAEANLRDHLATKLRDVLDHGDFVEPRHNLWGLPELPPRSAFAGELQSARSRQPHLPAQWRAQNSLQNPPVVAPADLAAHTRIFLTLAGACCWFHDLHESCWNALDPPFASMLTEAGPPPIRSSAGGGNPDLGKEDRYRDFALDRLLFDLLESLDADTRSIVRLAFGHDRTVREIEEATGIAKSTVARRLADFRENLAAVLAGSGYGEGDRDQLDAAIRDMLDG